MATGIVITVAEKVIAVLCSQELKDICSALKYESQLSELNKSVETIKCLLLESESKHQKLTQSGRNYIEKLKDAVYDVDDLLDEFNTMVQKTKNNKGGDKVSKKVRRFLSRSNQFLVAYNMSNEIKNLRSKLDKITKDRQQFGSGKIYVPIEARKETILLASKDNIIGRETEKEAIMGMLVEGSESSHDVEFVNIVGIGGLGKTALARLVYDDPRIEKAFELKMWVCVSDTFALENIFQMMLGGKHGLVIEQLPGEVRKKIERKRYLLVLDDVWNETRHEWDDLKSILNLGGKGSRGVVTSRSKKVASVVGDDLMYELQGLSDEVSWNLFKRLAFNQGKEPVNSKDHFFDVGKEIVKKCANVPLLIKVIGSMLYDQDYSFWQSLRSANLLATGQDQHCLHRDVLKYSYYHLTPALKSCFSYCALFPKDFNIEKRLLIRLWLAQGCLENSHDCRSEEDVGEEYFSILLHRCFFQDNKRDFLGEIESCKMHDLIHDLALEVAGKETVMFDSPNSELNQRISHVSLTSNGCGLLANPTAQLSKMKTLRTFLIVSSRRCYPNLAKSNVAAIFSHLRRLRVLDFRGFQLETLPDTVGDLLHLRYLDLSRNRNLKVLPNSITKLINLLVLCVHKTGVKVLPRDMKKLVNLKHLSLGYCYNLSHMPPDFDTLTNLHILTMFVAGDETSIHRKIGKLRDLRALVNLRNELTIKFNDNFRCDTAEYKEVELLRLAPLKHLIIQFSDHGPAVHETLLGCFQPHDKLSAISITSYKGFKFPLWAQSLASSLPQLVGIYLEDFDCLEILPSLSQLRHLKYLSLWRISKVEFMQSDGDAFLDDQLISFPCLEELKLYDLPKLKGWWRKETNTMAGETCASSMVVRSFPRLRKLNLEQCPNLKVFPSCPKLISVKLRKCHEALTLVGSKTTTTSFVLYLEELIIDNSVTTLDCLFGESLGGIQKLSVHYFKGQYLPSLAAEAVVRLNIKRLEIWSCRNLKSLSGFVEHLTNLQNLTIEICENLELENNVEGVTVRPWNSLHLLSSLVLDSLPKLINLPEALQDLTSLEHLKISICGNLESLPEWLNCLTSLQTLSIMGCRKLKSLPEAIAYMPSLKTLNLTCSEVLKKRCSKPDGEDWPKICRIPLIWLQGWTH